VNKNETAENPYAARGRRRPARFNGFVKSKRSFNEKLCAKMVRRKKMASKKFCFQMKADRLRFMEKSGLWRGAGFGMLAVLLALGLVLAGCPNDTEEGDTWTNATSLDQMNGTWKGSVSQTQSIKDFFNSFGLGNGSPWNDAMAIMFGDMNVKLSATVTMTIDASAKTRESSTTVTMAFSGGNIGLVWNDLKKGLMEGMGSGVTANDENHSITMSQDVPKETLTEGSGGTIEEMLKDVQINQNGTKMKVQAASEPDMLGITEIIFEKQ
jgi:hypothetical protein